MEMSRFKFRLWDKQTKRFVQSGIQFNNTTMCLDAIPQIIPMQWAGLDDCRGVDIYEGDILELSNMLGVVRFGEFKECNCTFWGWYVERDGKVTRLNYFEELTKVVGNIFENPNLLQNKSPCNH